MAYRINQTQIELLNADITEQCVDAIVNAANASLAGGGGVDGTIHRAGGPEIMKETREKYLQGCPTGSAVATGAGNLPAKYVFHAIGPVWSGGTQGEPEKLQSTYHRCLELAVELGCRSIAFPSISTGAYGYPVEKAAPVVIETVLDFLRNRPDHGIELVRFCLFSQFALREYSKILRDESGMENARG